MIKTTTKLPTVKLPTTGGTKKTTTTNTPVALYSDNLGIVGGATTTLKPTAVGSVSGTVKTPNTTSYMANILPANGKVSAVNITDEGAIVGNPNVTPMPTIVSSTKKSTTTTPVLATTNIGATNTESKVETTPPVTTADTQTTTTETEAEETPMTYEEYIASEKERAEQERADSIKAAETAKERAMIDAQSAYAQNKATYGTNAEQMAQMGLTGGGYSDYLQAQAYAQKRDDVQNANLVEAAQKESANATYSETISTLNQQQIAYNEQKEAERLAKEEEEKTARDNLYTSLWAEVQKEDTTYTAESIADIAKRGGLSDEEIATLTGMLNTTISNRETKQAEAEQLAKDQASDELKVSAISQIESSGGLSASYIQSLKDAGMQQDDIDEVVAYNQDWYYKTFRNALNSGEFMTAKDLQAAKADNLITEAKYNELLAMSQSNYNEYFTDNLDTSLGDFDFAAADKAYREGNISQAQYDALKNKFNTDVGYLISAATLFYNEDGSLKDESAAKTFAQVFKDTGWLSVDNTTKLDTLLNDTYKKEEDGDGGGCFASGTMVTVADGSRVPIETLKEGDDVLVFNHVTGKADTAKILFIYYEGLKEFDILKLNLDGTEDTEVITAHGFFDLDLNKYILITFDNVAEYVGHKFLCVEYINGETIFKSATLKGYEIYKKETECFAVISTKHINSMANDLLTIPDNNNKPPKLLGFGANLFNYNADHTYNKEEMASDIEKYGLVTYDEWCNIAPDNINLSGLFFGIGGEYLKIAVGKGVMTLEELQGYIEIGAKHNGNS